MKLLNWLDTRPASWIAEGENASFWKECPEAITARALRTNEQYETVFSILATPLQNGREWPVLLRELYYLFQTTKSLNLCYRTLLRLEKLAEAAGSPDPWVLETLARVCAEMGTQHRAMFAVAYTYLTKLEAATGTSKEQEKAAILAQQKELDFDYRPAGVSGADL